MSEENDGVLGNLPRSRPGVRSEKRASGGKAAKPRPKPKPKAKAKAKAAAKPKATPKAAPKTAPPPPRTPPPPQPGQPADPIGIALKAGETVARTGFKVAGRVAGEVMRRLPRP